jgi:predicted O-linked N-acetylglucosamine transferase (SPINDLY family)
MNAVSDEPRSQAARLFDAALRQHRAGNLAAARDSCLAALSHLPDHAPSHFVLGVIEMQGGKLQLGIDAISKSLDLDPRQPQAHANLASAYNLLSQPAQALICCERALRLSPNLALALTQRAVALRALGRHLEALEALHGSLRLAPTDIATLNQLGKTLTDMGRCDEAIEACERALSLEPENAVSRVTLGIAQMHAGRPTEALRAFDTVIAAGRNDLAAHYNRGAALLSLQRPKEALAAFEQALQLDPNSIDVLNARALALAALDQTEEAVSVLRAVLGRAPERGDLCVNLARIALTQQGSNTATLAFDVVSRALENEQRLSPGGGMLVLTPEARTSSTVEVRGYAPSPDRQLRALRAELRFLRGLALQQCGRWDEAIEAYRESLATLPDQCNALNNVGSMLIASGKFGAALEVYSHLHRIAPGHPYLEGQLFMAAAAECQWSVSDPIASVVEQSLGPGNAAYLPLPMLAISDRADLQLQCARGFVQNELRGPTVSLSRDVRFDHDRPRIGYLSGDFGDHAVSFLMTGVFEHHDRTRFATYALSLQPLAPGAYATRIRNALEHCVDLSSLSDSQAAARIRELEIDVLIDLSGHTRSARPAILSQRPAPLQINYLGYPGTSGADYIDYLIADEFVIDPSARTHYSERILYLPDCFQANDDRRYAIEAVPSRAELGLPSAAIVLCTFNNLYKLNPAVFSTWMRVLQRAPASVLWLVAASEASRTILRRETQARGVDPDRLVFAPVLPYEQHLARMPAADLFLDTWPFNGGTTVSDALWAGVPVLTRAGEALASRMAGSLLHSLGLDELVTATAEHYERRALELALDPERLGELRRRVATARSNSPLFDTRRFTRHFESALLEAHRLRERDSDPQDIRIAPTDGSRECS